tara:strand:- start:439 stop:675 length:237 start_codon:yes stop_codon:yes gene_type:complete
MNYLDLVASHENADEVPNEYFFERIRKWRDRELAASDWTQLTDSQANKTAWKTYRQALRDLPASNEDPKKIVFPTRPE